MAYNPLAPTLSRSTSTGLWTQTIPLTTTGDCQGLFNLYPSLGDVTYAADYSIPTTLDGPMKVARYRDLTINAGVTLTASQRCKQLVIMCENLTLNGTISMTARGCAVPNITNVHSIHPLFPNFDLRVPKTLTLSSKRMPYASALAIFNETGYALWDQGLWAAADPLATGFTMALDYTGAYTWMHSNASGYLASDNVTAAGNTTGAAAYAGTSGRNGGCGSGGKGGVMGRDGTGYGYRYAKYGSIYGGGAGGGGLNGGNGLGSQIYEGGATLGDTYAMSVNGYGGGAGAGCNAGTNQLFWGGTATQAEEGVGGVLLIICRGVVNIGATGVIRANGKNGSSCSGGSNMSGGGGSGGGAICIMYKTSYTKHASGVVEAVGGTGGSTTSGYAGGAGGAGSVQTIPFSTAFV